MSRTLRAVILAVAVLSLLSACKSTRPLIKAPLKEEGPEYLYSKLKENELRSDWISIRFDASYTDKKSTSDFKGQIRIRKDSLIWITVTPALGIEMFRMVITTDSVKYFNRFSKEYFSGDYALVNEFLQIHIDYDILQSLLLGNDFQFYETNSFRASIDNLEYKLSTTGRRKIRKDAEEASNEPIVLLQNIWLNPESFKITRTDVKEYMKDNRKLQATYGDFIGIDNQDYPSVIRFDIMAEEVIKMKINYTKVILDESLTFPFTIPDSYQRIK
jgi:hypothetical protein